MRFPLLPRLLWLAPPLVVVALVIVLTTGGAGRYWSEEAATTAKATVIEGIESSSTSSSLPRLGHSISSSSGGGGALGSASLPRRSLHGDEDADENKGREEEEHSHGEDDAHIEAVVEDLLQRLTLRDKIAQMSQIDINMLMQAGGESTKALDMEKAKYWIGEVGIGSVVNAPGSSQPTTPEQFRNITRQLQALAAEGATMKGHSTILYPLWGLDSLHGANYVHGTTLAPQQLNIAATFNVSCAHWSGQLASRDTRAAGISWIFSPVLGLALEPRWSRVYETYGEDPHLVGVLAAATVTGLQEVDSDPNARPRKAAACAKHFVAYSASRNGHDRTPGWIPTRHLYQYFVPPWKKVAKIVDTVMEGYTETDGVPHAANRRTLQHLLRQELQFNGVLVTDYEELRNLRNWHRVSEDTTHGIVQSLRETSIDVSMIPWAADEFLAAVESGVQSRQLSMQRLDESVRRVLRLKLELGLTDDGGSNSNNALPEGDPNLDRVGTDRDAALEVARQSIILAQNNGSALPLEDLSTRKILVVGPTSDAVGHQSGGWTWQWQGTPNKDDAPHWFTYGTTVLQAVRVLGPDVDVTHRCGVSVVGGDCNDPDQTDALSSILQQVKDWLGQWGRGGESAENSISRAVEAAQRADVIVVCVGEEAYAEKPGDIRSLRLPQGQYDLVQALRAAKESAKLVLVYVGGRPRLLGDMPQHADAVLLAFLAGPDAGQAVVDVVVGKVNPSGRLPITYPLEDDGGGLPYYHAVSDLCTGGDPNTPLPHFEYVPCPVQWEFGHGLSYTTFEYSDFTATGGIDRDLIVQVAVTNKGPREGSDTVLVFTFDDFRSTTPEYKRLRAFEKLLLQPNESKTLQFVVPVEDLKFVGPHDDHHYIIDPNMVTWVGVGTVDCRQDQSSPLCARLESPDRDRPYLAACDAACQVWAESGCAGRLGLTTQACANMCLDIGTSPANGMAWSNDGWGWDYVNCIESVIWGFGSSPDGESCSKLTTMCRDIFRTGHLDEFGTGNLTGGMQFLGSCIALFTALIASGIIVYVMNGGLLRRAGHDGEHIQFVRVDNQDEDELASR